MSTLRIYDLDGVLTRSDTFTRVLSEQAMGSRHRLLATLPLLMTWLLSRDPEVRAGVARELARRALRGLDEQGYAELAREHAEQMARSSRVIRRDVVARIDRERTAGDRIVIATASEERLVRALLDELGLGVDHLSASTVTFDQGGPQIVDHRIGERKLEALREAGIAVEEATFATDSISDLPTARAAAQTELIGARSGTRRRFAAEGIRLVAGD